MPQRIHDYELQLQQLYGSKSTEIPTTRAENDYSLPRSPHPTHEHWAILDRGEPEGSSAEGSPCDKVAIVAHTDVEVDVEPHPPRTCLTALGYQELSRPPPAPSAIGTVLPAIDTMTNEWTSTKDQTALECENSIGSSESNLYPP